MTQYTYVVIEATGKVRHVYGDEAKIIATFVVGRVKLLRVVGTFISHTVEEFNGTTWAMAASESLPDMQDNADDPRVKELASKIQYLVATKFGGDYSKAFSHYDTDLNNRIGHEELIGLLKDADVGNFLTRSAWASGIIERVDKDRDGAISQDELFSVLPR